MEQQSSLVKQRVSVTKKPDYRSPHASKFSSSAEAQERLRLTSCKGEPLSKHGTFLTAAVIPGSRKLSSINMRMAGPIGSRSQFLISVLPSCNSVNSPYQCRQLLIGWHLLQSSICSITTTDITNLLWGNNWGRTKPTACYHILNL